MGVIGHAEMCMRLEWPDLKVKKDPPCSGSLPPIKRLSSLHGRGRLAGLGG